MSKIKISYYFLIAILLGLFHTYIISILLSSFQSLPSPLFGGDYYFQLGAIHHMYETSILEWFQSANILGTLPAYLPLYGIVVTIFGKIFSLSPIDAMFDLNYILPVLSTIIVFSFLKSLFNSNKTSLLGSMLFVSFLNFPILKYTDFTSIILIPLFFYSLWLFYKEQNRKNALALGIIFALMSLAHTTSFAYATILIVAIFPLIILEKYLNSKNIKNEKSEFNIKTELKNIAPFFVYSFVLGFIIAQIIWFNPIFVYHGHSSLGNSIWTRPDFKVPSIAIGLFISHMKALFFNITSPISIVLSLSALVSLYLLIKKPFKNKESIFILFLFVISFLVIYSYFITSPLFDFHLVPSYMFSMFLSKIGILLSLLFFRDKLFSHKYGFYIFVILLIIISYSWYSSYDSWSSNKWFKTGKQPIPDIYLSLQKYLLENTNVNDVVLTNNELSFALNALSGRKLVVSRRSQNDPFMDFDKRELDSTIILYGNNLNEKLKLLKKYNVRYLYYDVNWFSTEYYMENGKITNYMDPMMLLDSKGIENKLDKEGIKYTKYYGWIDPAIRSDNIRKYNLLLISSDNYGGSKFGPWKPEIDKYLVPVWHYSQNGNIVAALYFFNQSK